MDSINNQENKSLISFSLNEFRYVAVQIVTVDVSHAQQPFENIFAYRIFFAKIFEQISKKRFYWNDGLIAENSLFSRYAYELFVHKECIFVLPICFVYKR